MKVLAIAILFLCILVMYGTGFAEDNGWRLQVSSAGAGHYKDWFSEKSYLGATTDVLSYCNTYHLGVSVLNDKSVRNSGEGAKPESTVIGIQANAEFDKIIANLTSEDSTPTKIAKTLSLKNLPVIGKYIRVGLFGSASKELEFGGGHFFILRVDLKI